MSDWVQAASLLLVSLTLLLTLLQLREVTKQSAALAITLQQGSHTAFQAGVVGYLGAWTKDDEDLLAWHLRSRGYSVSDDPALNKPTVYLLYKLEIHELNVLNHGKGVLAPELWDAWLTVMRVDVALPEFQQVWPVAKQYYAKPLADLVDRLLAEIPVAGGGAPNP
jgi:hypothetical protein